ncbi:hypothetical protein BDV30DRAFT_246748 [Aspergillus minisclerotigenes]|uniref:Uncharacterized protein n=1 Tax=Aspergillus minisclerotigenes TaxID=656917 RepID=A0A5N6JCM4_9EURO|nr:hypothetical protein BDV30DRAFT_246748 [Aspergillus minisclerotigenes]
MNDFIKYRELMEFRLNYHVGTGKSGEPRYKPCQVFSFHQIPHAIWFEDALVHYGVPTVVFDLLLAKAGWTYDMQEPHLISNAEVDLVTRIVPLPAIDWKLPLTTDTRLEYAPLEDGSSHQVPFPPLAGLLDALIDSWLDLPSDDSTLLLGLACQISYLYAHVLALEERSFAEQMKYEHRQFHFDVRSGMETGTLPFRRHQRAIRDALLQGQYELREGSASRDDPDNIYLFAPIGELVAKLVKEKQQSGDTLESIVKEC